MAPAWTAEEMCIRDRGTTHDIQMRDSFFFQGFGHFNCLVNTNTFRFPILGTQLYAHREITSTLCLSLIHI